MDGRKKRGTMRNGMVLWHRLNTYVPVESKSNELRFSSALLVEKVSWVGPARSSPDEKSLYRFLAGVMSRTLHLPSGVAPPRSTAPILREATGRRAPAWARVGRAKGADGRGSCSFSWDGMLAWCIPIIIELRSDLSSGSVSPWQE